jgi:hypothetical protein
MREETDAYRAQRIQWVTAPSAFIRFFYVREAGSALEYPFTRDFSTHPIGVSDEAGSGWGIDAWGSSPWGGNPPKLVCVKDLRLSTHNSDPVAGRSSIGTMEIDLGEQGFQILKQFGDPARTLVAIKGGVPLSRSLSHFRLARSVESDGPGDIIQVDNTSGYPPMGHVIIDNEDFFYSGNDAATNTLTGMRRAMRGTTVADHVVGALVRNGEQIRRGVRATLFLGYQPMAEEDYGPGPGYTKMEVQSYASADSFLTWTVRLSDIQRFTKRKVFELATQDNPAVLGPGHPITLGLQVLMSTGRGTNGPYDVLTEENGCGVPQAFVDIAAFEQLRGSDGIGSAVFSFSENEPQDGKEWFETQILRPLMILPDVNQQGQYTGRLITQPMFVRTGLSTSAHRAA